MDPQPNQNIAIDIIPNSEKHEFRQFMANPSDRLFHKSLGFDSTPNNWVIDVLRSSWGRKNRFHPPEKRTDEKAYFERKKYEFTAVVNTIHNYNKGSVKLIDILNLLNTNGSLCLAQDDYQRHDSVTSLNDMARNSMSDWSVYLGKETKLLVSRIVSVCKQINSYHNIHKEIELPNNRIDYLNYMYLTMRPLEILFHDAVSKQGDLLSTIDLLHTMINTKAWGYELSSNSMIVFNAILKNIGYNPIPIYALDFAAFTLKKEDFSKYVIYIMQNVEEQNIYHELPNDLKFPRDLALAENYQSHTHWSFE